MGTNSFSEGYQSHGPSFEWGLDFVEGGLVSENPKLQLLEYARRAVSESDAYHAYEPVQDWRLDGNHLTFTTPSPTPYPRNNTVHGWHFPVDSGGRVVLVPLNGMPMHKGIWRSAAC
jgi:hypothetical protein